jgi:hypothetical protein
VELKVATRRCDPGCSSTSLLAPIRHATARCSDVSRDAVRLTTDPDIDVSPVWWCPWVGDVDDDSRDSRETVIHVKPRCVGDRRLNPRHKTDFGAPSTRSTTWNPQFAAEELAPSL